MKILIVDDEKAARYGMAKALRSADRIILESEDGEQGLAAIRTESPDLVFLDLNMPIRDGMYVLQELQKDASVVTPEIIVVTANDGVNYAVDCIRAGAMDFITKPYDLEHVRSIARRSEERVRLQNKLAEVQSGSGESGQFGKMLGNCRPMQHLFRQISKAATTNLPVLVRGESGTGKELVARELHRCSARADGPFIAVNTAAIAETLVESELFGHVRGAFTGADRDREGVFRQADGGTLFLDEIGDMPAGVQTRLLRVLQESVVQPVGTEQTVKIDVRIISATHQDLLQSIEDRVFRQDLYFRLKGIELFIPPLRTRQEDILLLANSFVDGPLALSREAVAALVQHGWPGNVRELRQMIHAASALCDDGIITASDLGLVEERTSEPGSGFENYFDLPLTEARQQLVEDFERTVINRALQTENDNVSAAARLLGIHRQSLQQKMKQLGIR